LKSFQEKGSDRADAAFEGEGGKGEGGGVFVNPGVARKSERRKRSHRLVDSGEGNGLVFGSG